MNTVADPGLLAVLSNVARLVVDSFSFCSATSLLGSDSILRVLAVGSKMIFHIPRQLDGPETTKSLQNRYYWGRIIICYILTHERLSIRGIIYEDYLWLFLESWQSVVANREPVLKMRVVTDTMFTYDTISVQELKGKNFELGEGCIVYLCPI